MNVAQLRRSMVAGIAFVVLLIAGVIVTFGNSPNIKSSDSSAAAAHKWLTELSSSSHRTGLIIGAYLLIVGAIAFVWFSAGLREWLARDSATGRIISGLGVLGASAISVASMVGGSFIAGDIAFGNNALPLNGDATRMVTDMFFPFVAVVFGLVSAALIAILAASAMRSDRAPRWIAYTGWIAVLGALAGVFALPLLVALLWYLAIAITGLTRAKTAVPTQAG